MKNRLLLVVLCCLWGLVGCGASPEAPSMYIKPAQLSEEERKIAELLELNTEHRLFAFVVDDTIQSVQFNSYELKDGQWDMVYGGGGQAFTDTAGRVALGFNRLAEGLRIAMQSESHGGAVTYAPVPQYDFSGMGYATSLLSEPTEIIYEQEIPLVVQIITSKNEIHSYTTEYFHHPEEYEKYGYEHVYAVTVRFSRKTVAELSV